MRIEGKRVLLTGATGGLGEAAARALAERGATMVLSGRHEDRLTALAASLPGDGHEVLAADLNEPGAAVALIERAGEIDVLIANAGVPVGGALVDLDQSVVALGLRVNLETPIEMARAAIPRLRARGGGHIVLIASMAGKFALPQSTMYSTTKAGLRAFGWALRAESGRDGIGVSVITPGFIRDVGMFARRGVKTPFGLGTRSPAQFGAAVIDAIERDRGEIVLAPVAMRMIATFAQVAPGVVARVLARRGSMRQGSEDG